MGCGLGSWDGVDAVFVVKLGAASWEMELYCSFVDLERSFGGVTGSSVSLGG